jgi:hypothetical protein
MAHPRRADDGAGPPAFVRQSVCIGRLLEAEYWAPHRAFRIGF